MTQLVEETIPAAPETGMPPGKETLDGAQMAFEAARYGLMEVVGALRTRCAGLRKDGDVTPDLRDMLVQLGIASKALTVCTAEEAKARDKWLDDTGGGGIDMDAARAEIRSKLARLVPEGGA